jgi:hypothetical protein
MRIRHYDNKKDRKGTFREVMNRAGFRMQMVVVELSK